MHIIYIIINTILLNKVQKGQDYHTFFILSVFEYEFVMLFRVLLGLGSLQHHLLSVVGKLIYKVPGLLHTD
jgi:hypothetical protein